MMTLIQLRDKINKILEETPSWADVDRIGIVTNKDDDGFCDMDWLENFGSICCDGQGMVAFQLVMHGDTDYTND